MNQDVLNLLDEAIKADLALVRHVTPQVYVADLLLRATRRFLRAMPYSEYLQTEWWQERRREAIESAGGRCQMCDTENPGQVHHRTYKRRGREELADLVYLCGSCHEKFHDVFKGGDAPLLCKLCGQAMVADQGRDATFWFCPTGHGPIVTQSHKRA